MKNQSEIQDSQNIVIQGVSDTGITVQINGHTQEILNKLEALKNLLESQQAKTFQSADKIYNINSINEANFSFLMGKASHDKKLPTELIENLISEDNLWIKSLSQELLKQGVSVGNRPLSVFQHYGWLIEVFLQKMNTATGKARTLQRLSFMAEAYQSSLRYLCYVQVAQILYLAQKQQHTALYDFFQLNTEQYHQFDFLNFLLDTTKILQPENLFIPEINGFIVELFDAESELYRTALFLEIHRSELIKNNIPEDEKLDPLLDEYLTGLVFWLRKISFLAKYRLVSIKEINLNYWLGTPKNFIHLYGELHGMYNESYSEQDDFNYHSIEGAFTYNQSVLLFKGSNMEISLNNINDSTTYISLSPLIIDQSVFVGKATQTPEIYYYIGQENRQYSFSQYKNELAHGEQDKKKSNKFLKIKRQNNQQPKMDELFEQMERITQPFKIP